jgi:hypothetical protein
MASNLRVLVSNMDGNWGHWDNNTDALNTANNLTGNGSIYFPPGSAKLNTQPTKEYMFFASEDYIGWNSKSNWMIQISGDWDGAKMAVSVGRPTGIEDVILSDIDANFAWGGGSSGDMSGGSVTLDAATVMFENIVGPVTYVKFTVSSAGAGTSLGCYVMAWNEGDIYDGVAQRA